MWELGGGSKGVRKRQDKAVGSKAGLTSLPERACSTQGHSHQLRAWLSLAQQPAATFVLWVLFTEGFEAMRSH